jgi:hypothetical protein
MQGESPIRRAQATGSEPLNVNYAATVPPERVPTAYRVLLDRRTKNACAGKNRSECDQP